MLPIGVVIPTRNSARALPAHLAASRSWLEFVEQIVVVDSFSKDGTVELLQAALSGLPVRILSHPPGLYESWNFGISQVTAPYTYISTVGDLITAEGLRHLWETAKRFEADVVLSPPRFTEAGRELPRKEWTIHQYLRILKIGRPDRLPQSHLFLGSVFAGPAGMMGSSASNLYRTAMLQAKPFPCDFGHIGDTAWGVMHALFTRAAITPEPCASFELHPNAGQVGERAEQLLAERLLALAAATLQQPAAPDRARNFLPLLQQYAAFQTGLREADAAYYDLRDHWIPWFLRFKAWKYRRQRDEFRAAIQNLRRDNLGKYDF